MKVICKVTGGSRMYGLQTPESDTDIRGVFLNTDPASIIGLGRDEIFKAEGQDALLFEFRHFLKSLSKTNTQALELLFADEYLEISPEFKKIRENRLRLIDSKKLFSSLKGYIQNEKRLANGERTGNLGSKRKEQVEKYGFSPKNFSHLFRLAYCGGTFFRTSFYPVNISKHDAPTHDFIFSVKTEPWKYSREYLDTMAEKSMLKLEADFNAKSETFTFDIDFANQICLEFYLPFLQGGQE
jgi:hypothetical protein